MKKIRMLSILMMIVMMGAILSGCSKKEYNYKFYNAIENGNLEIVKENIEDGENINEMKVESSYELSPYKLAIEKNNKKIAEYLIENGTDVNYKCKTGESLLMFSAYNSDYKFCDLLIKHGADVNYKSQNGKCKGYTVLDFALQSIKDEYDVEKVVNFLIDNGAEVTKKSLDSVRDISRGKGYCRYGLVKKTLELTKKEGYESKLNPALEASILGDSDKVNEYIKNNQIDNDNREQILFNTVAFGKVETLKALKEKGADFEKKDGNGNTILTTAAKYGNLSIVEFFLENGADIEGQDSKHKTALMVAAENNQSEVVDYLIKKGAKLWYEDSDKFIQDVLAKAGKYDNVEMMKLIVADGYSLDSSENMGLVMDEISTNNNVEALKYLLEKGINPDIKHNGDTPLENACLLGNIESVKCLVDNGANVNGYGGKSEGGPLATASESGELDIAKYLIEKGANVNDTVSYANGMKGDVPLTGAIRRGNFDIIKLLVNNEANINNIEKSDTKNDDTPITLAAFYGSRNILEYLAPKVENINYQNSKGQTALMIAANSGREENVKILLKYNSDKSLKNNDGKTALDIARDKKYKEIVNLLSE